MLQKVCCDCGVAFKSRGGVFCRRCRKRNGIGTKRICPKCGGQKSSESTACLKCHWNRVAVPVGHCTRGGNVVIHSTSHVRYKYVSVNRYEAMRIEGLEENPSTDSRPLIAASGTVLGFTLRGWVVSSCLNCHQDFSHKKGQQRKYCCFECYRQAITILAKTQCQSCGDEFSHSASVERKFCCHECASKRPHPYTKRKTNQCRHCGEEFTHWAFVRKFCSQKCSNASRNARSVRVLVNCHSCWKEFINNRSKKRKFCSKKCVTVYRTGRPTKERDDHVKV